jgi:hypothetical protein
MESDITSSRYSSRAAAPAAGWSPRAIGDFIEPRQGARIAFLTFFSTLQKHIRALEVRAFCFTLSL